MRMNNNSYNDNRMVLIYILNRKFTHMRALCNPNIIYY